MSFPSVSRKRTNSPTVGICDFGMITLPPLAATRAAITSTIFDRKCRLDAIESGASARNQAFVHEAENPGRFLITGMDQVKARRSPGFENPLEHRFVKRSGAGDIVNMNGKCGEIIWHGGDDNAI